MQLKESIKHSDSYDGCLLNSLLDFPEMDCLENIVLELIIHCTYI